MLMLRRGCLRPGTKPFTCSLVLPCRYLNSLGCLLARVLWTLHFTHPHMLRSAISGKAGSWILFKALLCFWFMWVGTWTLISVTQDYKIRHRQEKALGLTSYLTTNALTQTLGEGVWALLSLRGLFQYQLCLRRTPSASLPSLLSWILRNMRPG